MQIILEIVGTRRVELRSGKKPEILLKLILEMAKRKRLSFRLMELVLPVQ